MCVPIKLTTNLTQSPKERTLWRVLGFFNFMRRTAKIKKNLSTAQILIDKKKEKIAKLKKQIEILETLPLNDMGHVITVGGAIYGE